MPSSAYLLYCPLARSLSTCPSRSLLALTTTKYHSLICRSPDKVLADRYDLSVARMTHLTSRQNAHTQMHLQIPIQNHVLTQ